METDTAYPGAGDAQARPEVVPEWTPDEVVATEVVTELAIEEPESVGEPAVEADLKEISETVIDAVEVLLGEVEEALSRLDDGTYGQCALCGDTIDDAFLAEAPTTRSCSACSLIAV